MKMIFGVKTLNSHTFFYYRSTVHNMKITEVLHFKMHDTQAHRYTHSHNERDTDMHTLNINLPYLTNAKSAQS